MACTVCPDQTKYSDPKIRYAFPIDEITGRPNFTKSVENATYVGASRPNYLACKAKTSELWNAPSAFSSPGTFGITACRGYRNPNNTINGVLGLNLQLSQLSFTLASQLTTPQSFVYVLVTDGTVVATSTNQSLSQDGKTIVKVSSITDKKINSSSTFLRSSLNATAQNWTSFPKFTAYTFQDLFFQSAVISYKNIALVIVNGALQTDYIGNFQSTLETLNHTLAEETNLIIGITVALSLGLLLLDYILTHYFIVRPLQKVSRIIKKATKGGFESLGDETNKLSRSFISEFDEMNEAFYAMIERYTNGRVKYTLGGSRDQLDKGNSRRGSKIAETRQNV